jgi:Domain of unknown function (DUF4232)
VSDVDSQLRERLGAAAAFDVEADPQRVREDVARRQRRIRRRRRGTMVVGLLAVAGLAAGAVRLATDGSGEDPDVRASDDATAPPAAAVTSAQFPPTPGWHTVQTAGGATAANVPLGPESRAGSVPWDTVATLRDRDIVLFAMVFPATEVSRADGSFLPRELPLSLDDAQPGGLEGQPEGVYAERLLAEVDGWNVDVVAFYGGASEPSAATRATAQRQLARLQLPAGGPAAELNRTAAAGTCRPSDLVAEVSLAESGGALTGHITVRNVGPSACTLSGRAEVVEPRDNTSTPLAATMSEAAPAWQQANGAAPDGWPAVEVAPGAEAQAVLSIRNWCGAFDNRIYFVIQLPGYPDRIGGPAPSVQSPPLCSDARAPMEVAYGPFEPL